ncbi:MAG: hypothetical protein H0A75_01310 [Candidatus Methanofishera endochildressiae]|uniref:Uncharacterized protein n=1 Tax=Candidatus Methanofishera endochildressiae TaxID=2738884 RepID=A0A7Z0MMQ8_9GAMM|nr:hypothetical protein [Candidatus Methanofishera endochildressiae]
MDDERYQLETLQQDKESLELDLQKVREQQEALEIDITESAEQYASIQQHLEKKKNY